MKRSGVMAALAVALDPAHALAFLIGTGFALGTAAAYADALSTPAMSGPLMANPDPIRFDASALGDIYVSGMLSGFALSQSNSIANDRDTRSDLGNAQIVVQKTDGLVQFYVQAGEYDILSLGTPTYSSRYFTDHTFGPVPQAYLKLAPSDNFSLEAGKLPALIGAEDTFSFQNQNVERGLLWNQTSAQTRGVQANYTMGPVAMNLSWNDGYYSDRFNAVSGLLSWTIDAADTLSFEGAGNAGKTGASTFVTPLPQNNSDVFDLIYTRMQGAWTLQPYVQYSHVQPDASIGIPGAANNWGGAVLADYTIAPGWNLAGRVEYLDTSGAVNLLYGPASRAWSFTMTPTFQYRVFFVRGEASYVSAAHTTAINTPFGPNGNRSNQFRAVVETGVVF